MKIKRLMMRLLVVLAMLAPVAAAMGVTGSAMAESGCHSTPPPGSK
ncbi:MAG: hypothetical protein AAF750_07090 [Planctomycetota bacterium]